MEKHLVNKGNGEKEKKSKTETLGPTNLRKGREEKLRRERGAL
jgi:hypothetical protein